MVGYASSMESIHATICDAQDDARTLAGTIRSIVAIHDAQDEQMDSQTLVAWCSWEIIPAGTEIATALKKE